MRITIRDIIEFLFLPLMTAAVWILWDMNRNINTLNVQVGVVISERVKDSDDIKDLKYRVRELELRK